jgi:hypothetical protein
MPPTSATAIEMPRRLVWEGESHRGFGQRRGLQRNQARRINNDAFGWPHYAKGYTRQSRTSATRAKIMEIPPAEYRSRSDIGCPYLLLSRLTLGTTKRF